MEDVWKTIPISTNYEASSKGRIRNKKTGYILKQHENRKGYRLVGIKGNNTENITKRVHRLVAMAFIENPNNKKTVNHKDHDRSENDVFNLEWSTHKEQVDHSRKRKLTTEELGYNDTWGNREVWKCDHVTGEKIEMFATVRDAACSVISSKFGMSQIYTVAEGHEISASIPESRQGITTASGFKWQFDKLRTFSAEEWCDVDPVIDGYQISTLGRLCNPRGKVKSPYGPGYSKHCVGGTPYYVHRLVALTFLKRVEWKDFVNHIDGDKNNPSVDNLEWVTLSENSRHAYATGLSLPTIKPVLQYDLDGNFLKEFESLKKAMVEVGPVGINQSIRTSSAAGGYIWKHKTDEKDRVGKLRKPESRSKKVRQYDMNAVFIREFDSIRAAHKEIPGLQRSAAFKGGSSAGYRWKFTTDTTPFTKKTMPPKKKISQYDLDMNFVQQHESISAARSQVPGAGVYAALKHSRQSKGYRWEYA